MDLKESLAPLDGWILERMAELLGASFHIFFIIFFHLSSVFLTSTQMDKPSIKCGILL